MHVAGFVCLEILRARVSDSSPDESGEQGKSAARVRVHERTSERETRQRPQNNKRSTVQPCRQSRGPGMRLNLFPTDPSSPTDPLRIQSGEQAQEVTVQAVFSKPLPGEPHSRARAPGRGPWGLQ